MYKPLRVALVLMLAAPLGSIGIRFGQPAAWPVSIAGAAPGANGKAKMAGPAADLKVDVVGSPNPVAPGGAITYTLSIINYGPDPAILVQLNLSFDQGVQFKSISTPPFWNFSTPPVGGSGPIQGKKDQVVPGVETVTITMMAPDDLPAGSSITAFVDIFSALTPDPSTGNNDSKDTIAVRGGPNSQSDLSVTKVGAPNPVAPGGDVTYTVSVRNSGPGPAFGVELFDSLDPRASVKSIAAPGGWICQTPVVGGADTVIDCRNPRLDSGAAAVFTIVATVGPSAATGSTIANLARISSNGVDPNPNNNQAIETTRVIDTTSRADLQAIITDSPDPVGSGERLGYTITINNLGPNAAPDVMFSSPLPPGTTFASLTPSLGCQTPPVGGTGTIRCNIGSLGPNASASFTYRVNVLAVSGTLLNGSVNVSSAVTDPNPANNSAATSTAVQGGAIVSLKWLEPESTAANPTPAPLNLSAVPGGGGAANESNQIISPRDVGPCSLVRVNIYKAESQPVQTIPSNLWKTSPPDQLSAAMAVAPAGSFYVITNVWNCGGQEIESGGSNQVGVPAGPKIDRVRLKPSGKMIVSGSGFTNPSELFIDGVGFARSSLFGDSTFLVQKGNLADGRGVFEVITPGKTVVISVRLQNGGISSIAFQL